MSPQQQLAFIFNRPQPVEVHAEQIATLSALCKNQLEVDRATKKQLRHLQMAYDAAIQAIQAQLDKLLTVLTDPQEHTLTHRDKIELLSICNNNGYNLGLYILHYHHTKDILAYIHALKLLNAPEAIIRLSRQDNRFQWDFHQLIVFQHSQVIRAYLNLLSDCLSHPSLPELLQSMSIDGENLGHALARHATSDSVRAYFDLLKQLPDKKLRQVVLSQENWAGNTLGHVLVFYHDKETLSRYLDLVADSFVDVKELNGFLQKTNSDQQTLGQLIKLHQPACALAYQYLLEKAQKPHIEDYLTQLERTHKTRQYPRILRTSLSVIENASAPLSHEIASCLNPHTISRYLNHFTQRGTVIALLQYRDEEGNTFAHRLARHQTLKVLQQFIGLMRYLPNLATQSVLHQKNLQDKSFASLVANRRDLPANLAPKKPPPCLQQPTISSQKKPTSHNRKLMHIRNSVAPFFFPTGK